MGKELKLGVLFKGEIEKSLGSSINNLKKLVTDLNSVLAKIGKAGGTKALTDLAKQANVTSGAISGTTKNLSAYAAAMAKAEAKGSQYSNTLSALTKNIKSGVGPLYETVNGIKQLTKASQSSTSKIQDAEKAMYKTDTVLRKITRGFNDSTGAIAKSTGNWRYAKDAHVQFQKAANLTTVTQKVLNGDLNASQKSIAGYIQKTMGAVAPTKEWNKAISDGSMTWQEASRRQSAYQAITDKLSLSQAKGEQYTRQLTSATTAFTEATKKAVPNASKMNKEYDAGTKSLTSMVKEQSTYQTISCTKPKNLATLLSIFKTVLQLKI